MNKLNGFGAMIKARTMEFVRDKGAFFWTLIFPFLMIGALTFLFGGNDALFTIGTVGGIPANFTLTTASGVEHINYNDRDASIDDALESLRRHQVDMVIDFTEQRYYLNTQSDSAQLLRALIGTATDSDLQEATVSGKPIRYADWIAPGVIGLNMMFGCLFGAGFVIVRYRKNGVLKRLQATPITALSFLSAQTVSRLMIVLVTSAIVYVGSGLLLNLTISGSIFALIVLGAVANYALIALGLIFAARIKNEELVNGLMNVVTWPMMLLSGVFFSIENAPGIVQTLSKGLPLTYFIDGARAIAIDGASLADITGNILFLAAFGIVCTLIAAIWFRWE